MHYKILYEKDFNFRLGGTDGLRGTVLLGGITKNKWYMPASIIHCRMCVICFRFQLQHLRIR